MFFQKPDVADFAPATSGEKSSLSDVFSAAWGASGIGGQYLTDRRRDEEAIDAHNDRVLAATGARLPNPLRQQSVTEASWLAGAGVASGIVDGADPMVAWRKQLRDLAAANPDKQAVIDPEFDYRAAAGRAAKAAEERLSSAVERSPSTVHLPLLGAVNPAALASGLASGLTNPFVVATLPLAGGGAGVGVKEVLWHALRMAGANAAGAAAEQPFIKQWRNSAGLDYTWGDAAAATAEAAAFGFVLEAGVRGAWRGMRRAQGREPVLDPQGHVTKWRKAAADNPLAALDSAARAADPASDIARAADGDPKALAEVARRMGVADKPEVRAALAALEADAALPRADGVAPAEHDARLADALRAAIDHRSPPPGDALPAPKGPAIEGEALRTMLAREPLDIAAEIRSRPELLTEGYPWGDGRLRQAALLSRLSDAAFERVAAGDIAPQVAALVADHVTDPARHADLARRLQEAAPRSPEAARTELARLMSEPRSAASHVAIAGAELREGRVHLVDDPHGADAARQLDELRREHADTLQRIGAEPTAEAGGKGEAKPADKPAGQPSPQAKPDLAVAEAVVRRAIEQKAAADLQGVIDAAAARLPRGVTVKSFADLAELPPPLARDVAAAGRPVEALTDPAGNIWIARAALDPAGKLRHETIHSLRAQRILSEADMRLLDEAARGVAWDRAAYADAYRNRPNFAEAMREEAIAHLYEQRRAGAGFGRDVNGILDRIKAFFDRVRNGLRGLGFQTADDILSAIDRGEKGGGAMFALADRQTGQEMRRELDRLGYYSAALEAAKRLKQAKGTPEQMLAQLRAGGAKAGEIEATGLGKFMEGRLSVTRDEIVGYLEQNRVSVNEKKPDLPEWSRFSLDPDNPTYSETVLHMPKKDDPEWKRQLADLKQQQDDIAAQFPHSTSGRGRNLTQLERDTLQARYDALTKQVNDLNAAEATFYSGHFSEPNIVGHMMTSVTKHEGRPVFTLDQIQSDWGQKLRDGGVRDEAKIAELQSKHDALEKEYLSAVENKFPGRNPWTIRNGEIEDTGVNPNELRRVSAELSTAKSSVTGHPLVNTTDQWTNTTLRRAIRQAAEVGADYIAVPHGDTVLSYNPGDAGGMRGFYGSREAEGIVPKNLRKLLSGLDRDSPKPIKVETLETPSGERGYRPDAGNPFDKSQTGFTLFPLTDKVKAAVVDDGQALFSLRSDAEAMLKADLEEAKSMADERAARNKERQALLDEGVRRRNEGFVTTFKDARGQNDPARALVHLIETHGEVPLPAGMQSLVAEQKAVEGMAKARLEELMHQFRPNVLGRTRETARLTNVVRELAGEGTGDAAAASLAKAWASVAERLRQEFNSAGGDIQKLEGWFLPQFHDRRALLAAKSEKWIDDTMRLLDVDRIRDGTTGAPLSPAEIRTALGDIWQNIVSDGHGTLADNAANPFGGITPEVKGRKKLANQRQEHRFLHFKSADAWLEYQAQYGGGADPFRAMMEHVTSMSKDIAALRILGTNPERELARLADFAIKQANLTRPTAVLIDEAVGRVKQANKELFDVLHARTRADDIADEIGSIYKQADRLRRKRWFGPTSKASLDEIQKLYADVNVLDLERSRLRQSDGLAPDHPEAQRLIDQIDNAYNDLGMLQSVDTVLFPRKTEMLGMNRADGKLLRDPVTYAKKRADQAKAMWDLYTGSASAPVDAEIAQAAQTARNVAVITRGGSMVISSVADNFASMMARRYAGLPVAPVFKDILAQFSTANRREAMRAGVIAETYLHMFNDGARAAAGNAGSKWSEHLAERTIALSGLGRLTDAQRQGFAMAMQATLADVTGLSLKQLETDNAALARLLRRYAFDEAAWDRLRLDAAGGAHAVDFLSPQLVQATAEATGRGADRLAERYLGMILQETDFASPTSMLRTKAVLSRGTRPGTFVGEALRTFGQFKSFAVMFGMLHLERAMRDAVASGAASGAAYLGQVMAVLTVGGALVVQLKDLKSGKDPQPMDDPKFWGRALLQGGGLGIMGDLIGAERNRFGGGLAGTIAGPVVGIAEDVAKPFVQMLQTSKTDPTDAITWGNWASKMATGYVPGTSLWYTSLAWQRLVADQLQKVLDPQAHKSFAKRQHDQMRDYGNEFFWAPGEDLRRPPRLDRIIGR